MEGLERHAAGAVDGHLKAAQELLLGHGRGDGLQGDGLRPYRHEYRLARARAQHRGVVAGQDADEHPCRGSSGHPSHSRTGSKRSWRLDVASGEGHHLAGAPFLLESQQDACLLPCQALRREHRVGLGDSHARRRDEQLRQVGVPRRTLGTGAEMFSLRHACGAIERNLDEPVVGQVWRLRHLAPFRLRRPRSFRMARNRCTRTVGSLRPSA